LQQIRYIVLRCLSWIPYYSPAFSVFTSKTFSQANRTLFSDKIQVFLLYLYNLSLLHKKEFIIIY